MSLLARLVALTSEHLTAFEYLDGCGMALALEHTSAARNPLPSAYDHYVLLELGASRAGHGLGRVLERVLGAGMEQGEVVDAVIAASLAQAQALWQLRESIPRAQRRLGAVVKHDIALPLEAIPAFLERAKTFVSRYSVGVLAVAFGHLGDGNIHFNLSAQRGQQKVAWAELEHLSDGLYDIVAELGGSFSAEHGIGRLHRTRLKRYRSALELELMRALKQMLDPTDLLNPGKVL